MVTPYAEAVSLAASGQTEEAIAERLRARGLDQESVQLLLAAVRQRAEGTVAPPSAEWTDADPDDDARPQPDEDRASESGTRGSTGPPLPAEPQPCPRCGTFMGPGEGEQLMGKVFCRACASRTDVSPLLAFRAEAWGKRDGWAWFMGIWGALWIVEALLGGSPLTAAVSIGGVAQVLFWAGWAPSRVLVVVIPALSGVLWLLSLGRLDLIGLVTGIAAVVSPRTRLFFKLEVSEKELDRAWRTRHDNTAARWGAALTFIALASTPAWLGLFVIAYATAVAGLAGALLGTVGLCRVNPAATPPVGRRPHAIFAVVGGVIALVASVVFLALHPRP